MNKERSNQGFTMAELVAVIAILGVMMAIVFANIGPILRGFYQKEMDETAQEIYVAAQNHLTIADSMGFLEGKSNGTPVEGQADTYYFVVAQGGQAQTAAGEANGVDVSTSMLSQMLPFGAIDETVRLGGSYMISYNAKNATVLDVFYRNPSGRYDNGQSFAASEYRALMDGFAGDSNKEARLNEYAGGEAIIGWYGGQGAGLTAEKLAAPRVRIDNAERLNVKAWWPNPTQDLMSSDLQVGLIITGKLSGARTPLLKVPTSAAYTVAADGDDTALGIPVGARVIPACLDDIASTYDPGKDVLAADNGHFAERFAEYGFIPGENVTISVFAYYANLHNNALYQVARGTRVSTNSLFASVGNKLADDGTVQYSEARIGNIRHLENLASEISGYDRAALTSASANSASVAGNAGIGGIGGTAAGGTGAATGAAGAAGAGSTMATASSLANRGRAQAGTAAAGAMGIQAAGTQAATSVDPAPTHARQIRDLSWSTYTEKIGGSAAAAEDVSIYALDAGDAAGAVTEPGTYMPVEVDFVLDYQGDNHRIADVRVNTEGAAGIFGALEGGSLTNIDIVNPAITSTGADAGALAASTKNTQIEGVLVRNETPVTQEAEAGDAQAAASAAPDQDAALQISAGGNAGGMVGSIEGGSVRECAAAVYVSGTNTGGLAGVVSGASVEDSYAGGHTSGAAYLESMTDGAPARMNVIASGTAGGLIGVANDCSIEFCYATASAAGGVAGGLVGTAGASGTTQIINTYAAGRVSAPEGAAGTLVGTLGAGATLGAGNRIVESYAVSTQDNGSTLYAETNGGVPVIGNSEEASALVTRMFADAAAYRAIAGADAQAVPYDPVLAASYGGRYPLPSIAALDARAEGEGAADSDHFFIQAHFGDWPQVDIDIVNVPA